MADLHWYDRVLNGDAFYNELVLEVVDIVRFTSYTSGKRTTDCQSVQCYRNTWIWSWHVESDPLYV